MVYVMGLVFNVLNDGGKIFCWFCGMYGDYYVLWIDFDNLWYLINGNDGGVVVFYDGGENWR